MSEEAAYKAYLDGQESSSSILNCYCLQEFKTRYFGVTDLTFENGESACKDWFKNYTLSNSLIYGLSAFIAGLGGLLRIFLREISIYEGKHTITERLASATTKMWSVQFISTALLLLIINSRVKDTSKIFDNIPEDSPILSGDFDDFYADWYGAVGVFIAVTCFFNTIVPWANFGFWSMKGLSRCWDRGCTCDKRKTKHLIQEEYEA